MKTSIRSLAIIVFTLVGFALSPIARAVNPPPDGGYPNGNTAEGQNALFSLTTGSYNTAVGFLSLGSATTGNFNTAIGAGALLANNSLFNTATGAGALLSNTNSQGNTANGAFALFNNLGPHNTAVGSYALFSNTSARENTAIGVEVLDANTTGESNTAVGTSALGNNVTGDSNTAIGHSAGFNITGSGNVCIGAGVNGEAGTDNRTYIRNINTFTQNFSAGVNDYVTVRLFDGRLGHTSVVSARRYKEDIKPLAAASQALYALKPVSFRLKKEFDERQALGFGLIADEVEKVNPDLVYRNDKGQVESVRYEMINAMLLNEFLKEHRRVEEQDRKIREQEITITDLKKEMETVVARLKEHDSKFERVSNQLQRSPSEPQLVQNR